MKKTFWKQLALLLAGMLLCTSLIACGNRSSENSAEGATRIGVCISSFDDTWNQYLKTAMEEYCAELGIDATFLDGKEDTAKQIEQVESFVIDKVDAIIVTPVNTAAVKTISETAIPAGIELIYVNRYPEEMPDEAYYVGSKEIDAGLIQGEFLKDKLQPGDKAAILMGKLDEEASPKRTEGVEQVIRELGGVVVDKQAGNWLRPEGMRITEDWITKYGSDLKFICSNNDDMAIGAIQALDAANLLENVTVLGIDATPDALNLLKAGKLSGTVFQDAVGQGKTAIDVALQALKGEAPEQETWIPFQPVTAETADDFLAMYQ